MGSSAGAFGYDGNGNPVTYKGSALAFDPENRMTSYGSAMTNGYGPDDLRAWKQGSSGTTYFLYTSMNQPVCEFNASGTLTATNTYGHVGLVSRRAGSTSTFYTFDPQGSVAQRLNASGGIVSSDTGDAFGSRATTGGGDVFGYIGQWGYYSDSETGLCLCQHRYYDPATGRFVTRDPIGYDGGINLYNYCHNNAVNGVDSTGYDPMETIGALLEGLAACEAIILGDTLGRGAANACADWGSCAGAAIVVAINLFFPEEAAAPVAECLSNFAGTMIGSIITTVCNDYTDPCTPPNFCQFGNSIAQGLAGCAEGFLGGSLKLGGDETLSVIAQVLDSVLDTAISTGGGKQDTNCAGG